MLNLYDTEKFRKNLKRKFFMELQKPHFGSILVPFVPKTKVYCEVKETGSPLVFDNSYEI